MISAAFFLLMCLGIFAWVCHKNGDFDLFLRWLVTVVGAFASVGVVILCFKYLP